MHWVQAPVYCPQKQLRLHISTIDEQRLNAFVSIQVGVILQKPHACCDVFISATTPTCLLEETTRLIQNVTITCERLVKMIQTIQWFSTTFLDDPQYCTFCSWEPLTSLMSLFKRFHKRFDSKESFVHESKLNRKWKWKKPRETIHKNVYAVLTCKLVHK